MKRNTEVISLGNAELSSDSELFKILNGRTVDGVTRITVAPSGESIIKNVTFLSHVYLFDLDKAKTTSIFKGCVFAGGLTVMRTEVIKDGFGTNFTVKNKLELPSTMKLEGTVFTKVDIRDFVARSLEIIETKNFLSKLEVMEDIELPKLTTLPKGFLKNIKSIENISLGVTTLPGNFLNGCAISNSLELAELSEVTGKTLSGLKSVRSITFNNLAEIKSARFLAQLEIIYSLNMSKVVSINKGFLKNTKLVDVKIERNLNKKATPNLFAFLNNRYLFGSVKLVGVFFDEKVLVNSTVFQRIVFRNVLDSKGKRITSMHKLDKYTPFDNTRCGIRAYVVLSTYRFTVVEGALLLPNEFFYDDGYYIYADGRVGSYVSKKTIGDIDVYMLGIERYLYSYSAKFLVRKDGANGHGNSIKDAVKSLNYKLCSERMRASLASYTTSTELNGTDAVALYRLVTGACELGTNNFISEKKIDVASEKLYTIKEIAKLTYGQYGSRTFRERFNISESEILEDVAITSDSGVTVI